MSASFVALREQLLRELTKEQVLAALDFIDGSGHDVYKPEALAKCGWPDFTVESVTEDLQSDTSNPKNTIFDANGRAVDCRGCYSLHVLKCLAAALDVSYQGCLGRGFEAREIDKALRKHLEEKA